MTSPNDSPNQHPEDPELPPIARHILERTDWAALDSRSSGEREDSLVPALLLKLLDRDPEVQLGALRNLGYAVQPDGGALTPVAAPAALFVAGILGDTDTTTLHHSVFGTRAGRPFPARPMLAWLLQWLDTLADAAALGFDYEVRDEAWRQSLAQGQGSIAVRGIRGDLHDALLPFLNDPDSHVADAAFNAQATLLRAPELADRMTQVAERFRTHVLRSPADLAHRRSRAAAVLALGLWEQPTNEFLDDVDPAIRACAALPLARRGDPLAAAKLRTALLDPRNVESWFTYPPPLVQHFGPLLRNMTLAAAAGTDAFEDLVPVGLALIASASDLVDKTCWMGLARNAVPGQRDMRFELEAPTGSDTEQQLGVAQRTLLESALANKHCWGEEFDASAPLWVPGWPYALDSAEGQDLIRKLLRSH